MIARSLFAFASSVVLILLVVLVAGTNAATTPVTIAGTVATVVSQLDTTTKQPQIKFWNNTNPNVVYLVTFVNLFESPNSTKVSAYENSIFQPNNWEIVRDTVNPNVVNFTSNYTPTRLFPVNPKLRFKSLVFSNFVNANGEASKAGVDGDDSLQYKAGKFDIIMTDYNFTDNHGTPPLVLTFQLNQTTDGNPNDQPLKNDQSLNIQFGMAYFAVNNTALQGQNEIAVSAFRAMTQFNMTNNNTHDALTYTVDNMQDVYVFYTHFDNGSFHHDPEYGFGHGVTTPGVGKTLIITVSVIGGVVVVAAIIAGVIIMKKRQNNRKNYSRF